MSTPTIKVLHVDDDYSFITIAKSILEEENFSVETACSADEALFKLKNGQFDVIISDYEMPLKNGLELLKEIRNAGLDIPFVLFTGKGREEIAVQALNLGADRYIDKHGDPKVVFTELSASIRQKYEKTQAKRLLWESEERFKNMVTNLNGIIMLTRSDGTILYISPSIKNMLGYEQNEFVGKKPWAAAWTVATSDTERIRKTGQQIMTKPGFSGSSEYQMLTKNGQIRWVNHSYSQIIENGQIKQIVSVITDITEAKKAQDIIKESEEKFSAAFHCSGAASCLTRVDDGLVIDANDCFLDFYGYKREEVIGNTVVNLRLYADPNKRGEIRKRALNNEPVINIDLEGRRKDGTIVSHLFSTKIVNVNGEKYFLSTIIDTSALKKAFAELSLSQKQLHDFIGMIPDAVTITDLNGKIVFNNELAGKSFGIPADKVKGMYAADFVVESEREEVLKALASSAVNNQVVTRIFHGKRTNGEIFPVDGSAKALRDEHGNVTGFIIITEDITEKNEKEEKIIKLLRDSERRESNTKDMLILAEVILRTSDIETALERILSTFRKIFDSKSGIITLLETNKIPGITIHQLGDKIFKQINKNPIELIEICQRMCKGTRPVYINDLGNIELINVIKKMPGQLPKNGIIVPLKMKDQLAGFTLLFDKEGNFDQPDLMAAALLAGFAQIALENNAAMEAVANSEKQLRVITDSAMDAIIMLDTDATVSFWSPAAEKMFGYKFEEIRGQDFHKTFASDKYVTGYEKGFRSFIKSGQGPAVGKTLELVAKRKSGDEFPIELALSSFKSGGSWKAVGIVRDISERKRIEQKLRESEERYRFVAEHANDIITVTDANGVFKYVSPSIIRVTGLDPDKLVGQRSVLEFLTPEMINEFNPKMAQLAQTGEIPPLQFYFNTPKGALWLETSVNLVRDEAGHMAFNAISRDITQRKLMEDKLKESEERYRLMGDYAQDLLTVTDIVGNYYYVSPSVEHLLGYKPEELVGKANVLENVYPDDIENFRKHIRTLPTAKELPPVEFRFRTKNGNYLWLEAKISTVQDNTGNSRFITISRDVTQRNENREELDRALSQAKVYLEKLSVVGGFVRHDIRNKLTNITNTLYMSKKYANQNSEMTTYLNRIDAATKSIIRILEFSQTYETAGSQGLSWIKVKEALQNAQILFAGVKDLEIEVKKIEYEVLADSALTEIFHNFIDNSIKYGGKNPTHITVYTEVAEDGNLQLIYEDNGAGIESSIKAELFKKGAGKGTGLGLYLIWRICDVYGWTIREEGKQGMGVRFVIEIPKLNYKS